VSDLVIVEPRASFVRDLIALTKPRIISLLLITTIAPMFVAGRPSWMLVLAVFVGGYLMAGGANAVNMYMARGCGRFRADACRRAKCSRSASCFRRRPRGCSHRLRMC
jgi:hypothetical protein